MNGQVKQLEEIDNKMKGIIFYILFFCWAIARSQTSILFVGGYTHSVAGVANGSQGIYVYRFDATSGKLEKLSNTDSIVNPSFLVVAPNGKFVYACTESRPPRPGSISAFSFDATSGKLHFLNKQSSGGENPVYVDVHKNGEWVVNGNYTGGNLAALKISKDGSLQLPLQPIMHEGKSIHPTRQLKPHVHSTVFSPDYNYVFVPDLGIDKVNVYSFSKRKDQPLKSKSEEPTTPGSGPRHFTFHPNGRFAFLVEEMSGTVVAYRYKKGKLTKLERLVTHPPEIKEGYGSADIHTSPDGKYLYVSNRGNENTITIFSINPSTGKLTLKGIQSTLGKTPRNFVIDPTGKFLLVANQATGNIVVFRRDPETGMLTPISEEIKLPEPTCLKMIEEKTN